MAVVESGAGDRANVATPRPGRLAQGLYGVGEVANSIKMVLFGLFVFFFYTAVMGLPGTLVGIASGIGLIWDAIIDPYIGHASDRMRWRLGRRHGFMLIGALTMGLTFSALFSPPRGLSTAPLFAWLLITSLLARLTSSVFVVPYHALGAELSRDYHERTVLTGIRGACALVGALGAAGLSFVLFFPNSVPGEDPKLNYASYPAMGLAFGLVMSAVALLATITTFKASPHGDIPTTTTQEAFRFIRNATTALQNPPFRALFLSFSLVFLGTVISSTLAIHFYTYYLVITESAAISAAQAIFYVSAIIGIPIWLRAARVIEKQRLYVVATIAMALLMLGALLLLGPGRPFGTGNVRPLLIGQALAGVVAGLFWILPASMLADVADVDARTTGQRREGMFFGIFSLGQQLATGLSVLVAGILLDWFAALAPGQVQSASTIERIGMLFSLLPAGLLIAGTFLIVRYPLTRRRVLISQAELGRSV